MWGRDSKGVHFHLSANTKSPSHSLSLSLSHVFILSWAGDVGFPALRAPKLTQSDSEVKHSLTSSESSRKRFHECVWTRRVLKHTHTHVFFSSRGWGRDPHHSLSKWSTSVSVTSLPADEFLCRRAQPDFSLFVLYTSGVLGGTGSAGDTGSASYYHTHTHQWLTKDMNEEKPGSKYPADGLSGLSIKSPHTDTL